MGVIASQSREPKAWRAAIATTQLVITSDRKEHGNRFSTQIVIARRAKPDEAIAFMVLSLKVFRESSRGGSFHSFELKQSPLWFFVIVNEVKQSWFYVFG